MVIPFLILYIRNLIEAKTSSQSESKAFGGHAVWVPVEFFFQS